jgi:hypothetical protein
MSYRYRIGRMPKKLYSKLSKCQSKREIAELMGIEDEYGADEDYLFEGDIVGKYQIDEISDEACRIKKDKAFNRFFKNKTLNDSYNDESDLFRISQADLLELIHIYEEKTLAFYKRKFDEVQALKDVKPEEALEIALNEIRFKISGWNNHGAIDTDLTKKSRIVNSWNYEYAIFDLLLLYKTVNFNSEVLFVRAG